jgi:serine/threonine-protein kinase
LENLLGEFIRTGPRNDAEIDAFCALGEIYLRRGFDEDAREALAKAVSARPGNPLVEGLLAELNTRTGRSASPEIAELPDLPPLPAAPHLPTRRIEGLPAAPVGRPADGQPLFAVGMSIAGRYVLAEEIGRGGMSIVFRASDLELGEDVALKFLMRGLDELSGADRLRRELKLSRQLLHPNVVRLYDIGAFRGFHYLSMELLSGRDLAEVLKPRLPLPTPTALDYLIEACGALQAAHERGIVHRDIKPSNLFVTTTGALKVMDFGIAKLHTAPGLTGSNVIVGTPYYIAPEQVTGFSGVTAGADLYSLGVVAFEMLTGTRPFQHREPVPLLMMHLKDAPPRPRERNPELPGDLEQVILRLLEKHPSQRYQSALELAAALEAIRRRL